MENQLRLHIHDIAYEAFGESIWDLKIEDLDLRLRCGDNCLTTEDHLALKGQTYAAPLGLEFVQLEATPGRVAALTLQSRDAHIRSGSDVIASGRISAICAEDLLMLESSIPLYLHVEQAHSWRVGDEVTARGLLCIMLEET